MWKWLQAKKINDLNLKLTAGLHKATEDIDELEIALNRANVENALLNEDLQEIKTEIAEALHLPADLSLTRFVMVLRSLKEFCVLVQRFQYLPVTDQLKPIETDQDDDLNSGLADSAGAMWIPTSDELDAFRDGFAASLSQPHRLMAPWSEGVVKALNQYQNAGRMHPYTCGNNSSHILTATKVGWVCPYDDYRQDWAHPGSLDPNLRMPWKQSDLESGDQQ